jgi:hypothetical protein
MEVQEIAKLYDHVEPIPLDIYPIVKVENHTMGNRLSEYIAQKIPHAVVDKIVKNKIPVEVHGAYDGHISILKKKYRWDSVTLYYSMSKPNQRRFKYERPKFYKVTTKGKSFIILTVFPGKDYVNHYASLLKNSIESKMPGLSADILSVFRYPEIEENIYAWSGLAEMNIVQENDVIIIGYLSHIILEFMWNGFDLVKSRVYSKDNLFEWIIMKNNRGHRILLLGSIYSYWGDIIGRIAENLYHEGASLIVHIANVGSCREPKDVYSNIFIPMFFCKKEGGTITFSANPWNPLLEEYWDYNSGIHMVIPTTLEETYDTRKIITRLGVTSVDTEATNIVMAAEKYTRTSGRLVGFSGVYICTDYVRKSSQKRLKPKFDLANRTPKANEVRERAIVNCIRTVMPFFQKLTITPRA